MILLGIPTSGAESELKALVDKLNLRKYVIFHGPQHGDALTKIFESSNIAVDSLGRHRSNNEYNCSLKSKEYCARGLPFVKSHKDDAFEGTNYFYQFHRMNQLSISANY